ncbi:MAG: hypothetical protein ACTIAQ_04260 [Glutamicibacter arilaitensis]
MKPGMIYAEHIHSPALINRLVRWFRVNGLRHHIPEDARIIFTGNRLIIPTFDLERLGQKNTRWTSGRIQRDQDGEWALPIKTRTYRVRVPFEAVK